MPRIPAFVRFLAVCAALCVLAAACGSSDTATDPDNSTAEPVPDATATVPTSPTVEANETPEPAPTTQSSLVAVAEEATSAAGLTGPFYEFTLVDYVDGATPDDYDHESFLVHGAELVYAAEVETQLQGDTEWDRVEVVFYPDTATYLGTLASDDYASAERDRALITADTHVALAEPIAPITGEPLIAGQEPELGPLSPPSEDPDDPPFMLVAAVEIVDQEALERHYAGASAAGTGGGPAGPVMWMNVTTTLVGDDAIDSVRFNYWSSHSFFESVIGGDPDTSNREDGLGAASTMMTLPTVDEFTPAPIEAADVELSDDEIAALYTTAAVDFLDATVGFTQCLDGEGQPWTGEPDPDDPNVDPNYLAALSVCAGELSIQAALVGLFTEDPEAAPVSELPEQYTTATVIETLVSIDTFTSCLDDAGFGWLGPPGEAADPDATSNTAEYQQAMGNCAGVSGIQAALDGVLS